MPYIFVEELPEGTEEAAVVPAEDVEALQTRIDEYEASVYEMAQRIDEAEVSVERWKSERDEARKKYADAMMRSAQTGFGTVNDNGDTVVSGDIFA